MVWCKILKKPAESELFTVVAIGTRHLKSLMPLKATSQKVIIRNSYEHRASYISNVCLCVFGEHFELELWASCSAFRCSNKNSALHPHFTFVCAPWDSLGVRFRAHMARSITRLAPIIYGGEFSDLPLHIKTRMTCRFTGGFGKVNKMAIVVM